MAGVSEVSGGLGLALGLLTPLAATAMIGTMTTAAWVNHDANGFWSAKKGWELNGYLIAVAWFVATVGPGRWSVDHALDLDLTGIVVGLLALTVGVGGGTVQWRSRSTD